jgi:hypothetical protein
MFDGLKYFWNSFRELRWEDDPQFVAAEKVANAFTQRTLERETAKLLIDQANLKYAERLANFEQLDRKREWLITFGMGAVTALAAVTKVTSPPPSPAGMTALACSLGLFIVAVLILVFSRRVTRFPGRLSIQSLREALSHEQVQPEDWLAASIHKSCEALRVLENRVAYHTNLALGFICVALIALIPAILL